MSYKLLTKFPSVFQRNSKLANVESCVQSRSLTKTDKKNKDGGEKCINKTCGEVKQKKSVWNIFGSKTGDEPPGKGRLRVTFSEAEGMRTGSGHRPHPRHAVPHGWFRVHRAAGYGEAPPVKIEPEEVTLGRLERHPTLKDAVDPMPPFTSVEQRLLKLCELKLHPEYKKHMSIPKPVDLSLPKHVYKTRSGPIADDEYPPHLKVSKECLDRKNVYAEFKRAAPPQQLLAKMLEIKQNEKPTLERKLKKEKQDC
ncbi:hypothetical protein NQ315_015291 [Exocentrus adspersus]|uniref:Uncharacterized protein n=1 Tax=Exocentrus adspersus TaxID=1586481 RepID=A0AAV8VAW2_9CUCU|nr:hypothetical protein NQ315_015291 [Exocentrus adspersus]